MSKNKNVFKSKIVSCILILQSSIQIYKINLVRLKIKLLVWVVYKGRVHCIDGD